MNYDETTCRRGTEMALACRKSCNVNHALSVSLQNVAECVPHTMFLCYFCFEVTVIGISVQSTFVCMRANRAVDVQEEMLLLEIMGVFFRPRQSTEAFPTSRNV